MAHFEYDLPRLAYSGPEVQQIDASYRLSMHALVESANNSTIAALRIDPWSRSVGIVGDARLRTDLCMAPFGPIGMAWMGTWALPDVRRLLALPEGADVVVTRAAPLKPRSAGARGGHLVVIAQGFAGGAQSAPDPRPGFRIQGAAFAGRALVLPVLEASNFPDGGYKTSAYQRYELPFAALAPAPEAGTYSLAEDAQFAVEAWLDAHETRDALLPRTQRTPKTLHSYTLQSQECMERRFVTYEILPHGGSHTEAQHQHGEGVPII